MVSGLSKAESHQLKLEFPGKLTAHRELMFHGMQDLELTFHYVEVDM